MNEKKGNQTESEALALWGTGRKGVEDMLAKMGGEIATIAAKNVQEAFDVWKMRALVEVSTRDELKNVIATRDGVFSIYKCLTKAATMGLQIGATFPHAYFVPYSGKAQLIITAEGYAFACVHGPGAVLAAVPEIVEVFEKDKLSIDQKAGTVNHVYEPFGDRGKLAGFYMRLEYRDGHIEVPTILIGEVESIAKAYSSTTSPAFTKSKPAMYRKIAAKQLLKKPVKEAEGLAMLLSLDDYEAPEYTPPPRDIGDRMADRLDASMRTVEPEADEITGDGSGEALPPIEENGDDVF